MSSLMAFGPCAWDAIPATGIDEWLWIGVDPEQPVNVVERLPEACPSQVTHLWGWGAERLLRARVDPSLGSGGSVGVVGAVLDRASQGQQSVAVQEQDAVLWPLDSPLVHLKEVPALYRQGKPMRRLRLVVVDVAQGTADDRHFARLEFVDLSVET